MKQYPSYKSVSEKWAKQIPAHWELKRLKNIFALRKEKNNPVITDNILSLTAIQGVVPYAEKKGTGGNKPKEDLTLYNVAHENDLLINCMNVVSGAAGVSKYFGAISPVYYALYPRTSENVWYYHHLFRLLTFQRSLIGLGKGIQMHESDNGTLTTVRMRISMDSLGNVTIPVPPQEEQDQIVRFLDWKVSEINRLIAVKKREIELWQDAIQVFVDNAIFSVSAPEIKFNHFFDMTKGLNITKKDLIDTGTPVISYGQIHSKDNTGTTICNELIRYVDKSYIDTNPNSLVQKGDFIFADTSEDLKGVGNCVYVDKDMILFAGYHTIIARPKDKSNNKYLAYMFKSSIWRDKLRRMATGVKVFSITQKMLKNTVISLPNIDEQKRIVEYLDKKTSETTTAISKINDQIQKLEELKKRLISDVVTGQIDVRNIAIPDFEYIEETAEETDEEE